MEFTEYLKHAWNTFNHKILVQRIRSQKPDFWKKVLELTKNIPDIKTGQERVFLLLNPQTVICPVGNRRKYVARDKKIGYCNRLDKCQCFLTDNTARAIEYAKNESKELKKQRTEKRNQTWIKKYNVDNISKVPEIREKRKDTIELRYDGNLWADPIIGRKMRASATLLYFNQVIDRLKNLVIPRFDINEYSGITKQHYPWKCVKCRTEFSDHADNGRTPRCPKCFPKSKSEEEIRLAEMIRNWGFNIETEVENVIHPLEIDIFLPDLKLGVEYNGIYWHSEIKRPDPNYHLTKLRKCQSKGIKLVQIFSNEWLLKNDIVLSRIRNQLGLSKRVMARKLKVVELDKKQEKEFLENNHLQGYFPSTISYALTDETGEIFSLMSFSKSRYSKNYQWELLRFSHKNGCSVIGGASRLFKHFVRDVNPDSVISYANRRWGEGEYLRNLGFEFSHNSEPNYFYTKDFLQLFSRQKFQKKKLKNLLEIFDKNKTEPENMADNGWHRVWDCGNAVWVFKKPSP